MLKCNEQYLGFITTSFRVILFLLCTTFVVHRGYKCFKKYMDKPEAIDLSYKFTGSDEVPFPSLTFCPYNSSFTPRYLFILTDYYMCCIRPLFQLLAPSIGFNMLLLALCFCSSKSN